MDELIADFLTETNEGLAALDNDLVSLEKNPEDEALLGNIFRIMHTIKGTCGFLGLGRLESVAHAGENILGKIRDKELAATPEAISLILATTDVIKEIVEKLEANGEEPVGDDSALIARVNAHAEGKSVEEAAPSAPAAAHAPVETVSAEAPAAGGNDDDWMSGGGIDMSQVPDDPLAALFEAGADANAVLEQAKVVEVAAPAEAPKEEAHKEDAHKDEAKKAAGGGGAVQSLRVNIDVLEELMQQVSELVLTRNQLMQISRVSQDANYNGPLQRLNLITSELQDAVMKTRMQPVGNAWAKFPRLIRDLARDLNKKIELTMEGEETELDRQLLEYIKDPLTHMVRNSADHGLEKPEERLAAGKSDTGNVSLNAYHESGHIVIRIADDGRGLNVERIRKKILEKGLATGEELANMGPKQVQHYIFHPGFSTAEAITAVSGRGVGMDVVKNNIEKIGGTVELNSIEGKGTTFHIKIPLTLAIMPVLIVEASKERFGIPQLNVLEMVKAGKGSEYKMEMMNASPVLRLRDQILPILSLSQILQMESSVLASADDDINARSHFIVVCQIGGMHFGIMVDRVFDTEEIVVKPVSPVLRHIDIYSGSTILGDGNVVMIMDMNGLANAFGEVDLGTSQKKMQEELEDGEQEMTLLMFNSGEGAPKVVPLEVVSRLEEVDMSKVEISGGIQLIQYRGGLMRVVSFDKSEVTRDGIEEVIVFVDDDKVMGMVVDEIVDIVKCRINTKLSSGKEGFLGSPVINDVTCELIDVSHYFSETFKDWHVRKEGADHERSILLVDDSPFFRKFIPPLLSGAGFHVQTAPGGQEALDMMHEGFIPDMIITDMSMPGMSGGEFITLCKQDERLKGIPVVALSAHSAQDIAASLEATMLDKLAGYVSKTNHSGLLELVKREVGR
jgi:two-component system chemotaxis sensor kinase CheA